jgi:hypothetical protein
VEDSTINTEADEPKAEQVDKRDTPKFWQKWIAASKYSTRRHWDLTRDSWREFDGGTENTYFDKENRNADISLAGDTERYPIFWSRVMTVASAYYSRTPETYARRVFGSNDDLSMAMSMIMDRLGQFLIRNSGYDSAMKAAVFELINGDKTTVQVCYEHQEKTVKKTRAAKKMSKEDGSEEYVDAETEKPVTAEVLFEPSAGYMYDTEESEIDQRAIKCKPVIYDRVLHTPTATMPEEIEDQAYYFYLTKEEAIKQFGDKSVNSWPDKVWKSVRSYEKERQERDSQDKPNAEKFIEGWEIWSKVTKKVYFYCPDMPDSFMCEPKEDPYKLKCFFPSPRFVITTKPAKSLYPTPVYTRLKPTIQMLHIMYGRVFNLIDAVRRRAIVDGTSDELAALLNDLGDTEFIAVQNMQSLVEKGGLDSMVWYLPVGELVSAIGELNQQDDKFKENIDEWFGTPAILQGTGDPIETATAQEIKVSAAHDRFKNIKNAFAEMARETLEMMIDLALEVWPPDYIYKVTGWKYEGEEQQLRFEPALQALKNDTERVVRIELDTDTTSYIGEQIRQQQRTAVVQTLTKGLQEVSGMIQTSPSMGALAMKIMVESLANMPGGPMFIDETRRAMQEEIEKMNQPPPPAPPDPAVIKAETEQFKAQTDRMKAELEAMKAEMDTMDKAFKAQLAQQKQEFQQYIDQSYLDLDATRTVIEAQNKESDNARLEVDSQAKLIEAAKPESPKGKESATTVIINAPSQVPETPSAIDAILKGV